MAYKQSISISVDDLNLLLSFYDDLEEFNQGLERICKKHRKKDVGKLLESLVLGKKPFMMPNDVKEFYEEHQDFFQAVKDIRQRSPYYLEGDPLIYPFLITYYDIPGDGHLKTNYSFGTFYQYLQDCEGEIPKIQLLVDKLKSLHISDVTLDEDADFTEEVYNTSFWWGDEIVLLDNMETLPNYNEGVASYYSTYSKYKITRPYDESVWYHKNDRKIILTQLAIDPDTLPSSLEDDDLKVLFSNLKEESMAMNQAVRQSAVLYSATKDYETEFGYLGNRLKSLSSADIAPELQQALSFGEQALNILREQQQVFDQQLMENYPELSGEQLEKQKKSYRRKVLDSRIDWD